MRRNVLFQPKNTRDEESGVANGVCMCMCVSVCVRQSDESEGGRWVYFKARGAGSVNT